MLFGTAKSWKNHRRSSKRKRIASPVWSIICWMHPSVQVRIGVESIGCKSGNRFQFMWARRMQSQIDKHQIICSFPRIFQSFWWCWSNEQVIQNLSTPDHRWSASFRCCGSGGRKICRWRSQWKRERRAEAKKRRERSTVPAVFYEVEAPDKGEFAFSSLYRGFLGETAQH